MFSVGSPELLEVHCLTFKPIATPDSYSKELYGLTVKLLEQTLFTQKEKKKPFSPVSSLLQMPAEILNRFLRSSNPSVSLFSSFFCSFSHIICNNPPHDFFYYCNQKKKLLSLLSPSLLPVSFSFPSTFIILLKQSYF